MSQIISLHPAQVGTLSPTCPRKGIVTHWKVWSPRQYFCYNTVFMSLLLKIDFKDGHGCRTSGLPLERPEQEQKAGSPSWLSSISNNSCWNERSSSMGQGCQWSKEKLLLLRKTPTLNNAHLDLDFNLAQQANKTKNCWRGGVWVCQYGTCYRRPQCPQL